MKRLNVQQIKSVLVAKAMPALGTYFGCKLLYRFDGLNIFGQVGIPDRCCIFKVGTYLTDIHGSKCTGIRVLTFKLRSVGFP